MLASRLLAPNAARPAAARLPVRRPLLTARAARGLATKPKRRSKVALDTLPARKVDGEGNSVAPLAPFQETRRRRSEIRTAEVSA